MGELGAGRCATRSITPTTLEECQKYADELNLNVADVIEYDHWGWPCGCHYNQETEALHFNAFVHPCYCWNEGCGEVDSTQHRTRQNEFATNLQPICSKIYL